MAMYSVHMLDSGTKASADIEDRAEAEALAREMHRRGLDVELRKDGTTISVYDDDTPSHEPRPRRADLHQADESQPYDSYQSPGLNQVLQRAFGDTPGLAVHERRCIAEPIGCGRQLPGLCREEFGGTRPCVAPEAHAGEHTDQDHYAGNMAIWQQFPSQAGFDEWTITGLCPSCQARLDEAEVEA
jgi:hypothetical protein